MAAATLSNTRAAFSGQWAPEAEAQARSCGQPSRGLTRRSSERPKLAITRAAAPMFSASCGAFRITTGAFMVAAAMSRLEKPRRPMATPSRRSVLALAPAAVLAACGDPNRMRTTVSNTPKLDIDGLNLAMAGIAARARADALGVGLMNLESGEVFSFNGDRLFPMQSVFKLLLGAYALSEVEAGRLRLDDPYHLTEMDLSPPHSPIGEAWPARKDFTWGELLREAVVNSDNTAADVLMRRVGGPGALTAWLAAKRAPEIRVDRYERELASDVYGMPSFRPEWRTPAGFAAARARTPPAVRAEKARAYLLDPRDTATPRGMVEFLHLLDGGVLLNPASTRELLRMMMATTRGAARIKAGLPQGTVLAHRPGTSGMDQGVALVTNDVGIFTLADRRSYALAVFLAGSTLGDAAREAIIAAVASSAVEGVG
jgi:beta-lactamase class A